MLQYRFPFLVRPSDEQSLEFHSRSIFLRKWRLEEGEKALATSVARCEPVSQQGSPLLWHLDKLSPELVEEDAQYGVRVEGTIVRTEEIEVGV